MATAPLTTLTDRLETLDSLLGRNSEAFGYLGKQLDHHVEASRVPALNMAASVGSYQGPVRPVTHINTITKDRMTSSQEPAESQGQSST